MSAQNMDSSAQQGFPTLCSNGCGFFSSVDSKGLCSVCFKETLKKETSTSSTQTQPQTSEASTSTSTTSKSDLQQEPTLSESTVAVETEESKSEISTEVTVQASASASTGTEDDRDEPVPAKKPKKSRCLTCKKKLGLTGFTCRCGDLFCSLHRYSDMHNCTFDYSAMGKKEIRENNPVIVAQKVAKI